MAMALKRVDLEPLLLGGCFFGSGGGGTIESAQGLVAHFEKGSYYPSDEVRVVSVAEATEGEAHGHGNEELCLDACFGDDGKQADRHVQFHQFPQVADPAPLDVVSADHAFDAHTHCPNP